MEGQARLRVVEDDVAAADSLLSQVSIIHERDGGKVEAMVPVDLIYREDVPVDQAHVDELAESILKEQAMRGDTEGQLSPVLLAEIPDRDTFLIIDGFHRDAALHQIGNEEVFSTIRRDSTMDEVVDLRILTANTHASVTFARIVEWVQDAWHKSPWAENLTAAQAFSLSRSGGTGRRLGLTPEEATEVLAWTADKCDRWRISKGTVYQSLATAQMADPELVKEARRRTGKHALTAITPQHLTVIAKALPKRYPEQRLVAKIAKANNFNLQSTRAVVEMLQHTSSLEEAQAIADETDWSNIKPSYGKTTHKVVRSEVRQEEARHRETYGELLITELELAKVSLENSVLRGRYIPPPSVSNGAEAVMVDVGDNPRVVELLSPTDVEEKATKLLDRAEILGPKIIELLQTSAKQSPDQASATFNGATRRIGEDIEAGGLRFVRLEDDAVFDRLIRQAVKSEARRRAEDDGESQAGDPTTVGMPAVIEALPHMNSTVRRILALNNFFRLPPAVTAQVLEVGPEVSYEVGRRINLRLESMDKMLAAAEPES